MAWSAVMDSVPVSERLPRLYRAVLDAVAELEVRGRRDAAARIRSDATAAYSRAWNATAERRLMALETRARRIILGERRPLAVAVREPVVRAIELDRTSA